MKIGLVAAMLCALVLGCGGGGGSDAPSDAGPSDADADAGAGADVGALDAQWPDAGQPDGGGDAGGSGAALSTLSCEVAGRPGPIPQPPGTLVSDFGPPVRLPASVNDACPNDAVEVAADGRRIYYSYSVNKLASLPTAACSSFTSK